MRQISLLLVLFLFWLALSGHYTGLLLSMGVLSAAVAGIAARRMRTVDAEGHPIEWTGRFLIYLPWLAREIGKSAWGVTKIVVNPRLPISPTLTTVKATQRTSIGIATYANSITLTPGTITVAVSGNELTVHALVREGAADLHGGEMNRRVRALEGPAG
ncbi:MAG TPA: Na+/H+ antiporter subunit E [Methylomirabilota bacterium]|jgi:multicomponent Na+:H+ antiporter subunit E|nr:Na+/H+ antiporter subunit E [Methylomirabilota bacterium]